MFKFPGIRVGDPIRRESLTVFPLFTDDSAQLDYLLSDEAIQSGVVTIQEVSEAGSVPELLAENRGDTMVLFIEGEELVGAKQNRILNTSVLLGARSKLKIPVSCVEQGRWAYQSRHFGFGGRLSPSKLRHTLKASVSESLAHGKGHRSNQGKVWEEVGKKQAALGVSSNTAALADSYQAHQQRIDEVAADFHYPEGAAGLAVALGDKLVAVDVFDKPATCHKVWRGLLAGFILDAVATTTEVSHLTQLAVEEALTGLLPSTWEQVQPVGDGEEYRVRSNGGTQASVLTVGQSLVHGSLMTGVGM